MGALEQLQELVAKQFEKATSKEEIDSLSKIKTAAEEAKKENDDLLKKHQDLLKDYKDAILNTAVKKEPNPEHTTATGQAPDFDSMLHDFIEKSKEKK